ncbi:MAG: RidA family protein [Lysobacterales bacterium]|jgi:enamine deaminase RidA (YjgF/YER057c/UK114 family)
MSHEILLPAGWPRPNGYANGIAAEGRLVFVAGQIGWDENRVIHSERLAVQVEQALKNTVAVLAEAGAGPQDIVRMTWYVTSRADYLVAVKEIGAAWRAIMGKHYPAMAVVEVSALIESSAKVEIETTAVVPAG